MDNISDPDWEERLATNSHVQQVFSVGEHFIHPRQLQ